MDLSPTSTLFKPCEKIWGHLCRVSLALLQDRRISCVSGILEKAIWQDLKRKRCRTAGTPLSQESRKKKRMTSSVPPSEAWYEALLSISRQAADQGSFEVAYHTLAAALSCVKDRPQEHALPARRTPSPAGETRATGSAIRCSG